MSARTILATILASSGVLALRLSPDVPWERSLCGIIGYTSLLLAWIVDRVTKRATPTAQLLRAVGYAFLLGTPSYTRMYDGSLVLGVSLALLGYPQAMPVFTALYHALAASRATSSLALMARAVIVVVLSLNIFKNPLVR